MCQVFCENLTCSVGPFAEGKFCMDRCSKGGKIMKVVIVDDDRLVSMSLKTILESDKNITVAACGQDGEEAVAL